MLVWQHSEAGSIREDNQDVLVIREDQGVVLLIDGQGPAGRDLAREVADRLEQDLAKLPLYGRPEDAPQRLRAAIADAARRVQKDQVAGRIDHRSGVSLAAAVVVEGQLVAARAGTAGLLAWTGGSLHGLEPRDLPRLADVLPATVPNGTHAPTGSRPRPPSPPADRRGTRDGGSETPKEDSRRAPHPAPRGGEEGRSPADATFFDGAVTEKERVTPGVASLGDPDLLGPLPLTVGDWVMVFSEGLLLSQPLDEVARVAGAVTAEPDEIATGLFARASRRYDGDDRTMALVRFLPADLRRRFPPDTVLSVDLDRRLALPLWKPLAVLGSAFLAAGTLFLVLWRKLR